MSDANAPGLATASNPAIDPKLVIPFMNAVRGLFETMVRVDVKIGRPFIKSATLTTYEVSSIIGFSGEMSGSIAATFSKEAATRLVESFAGMPIPIDSPDFADAIGELANMIAGGAKREFGMRANISVPTVIIGRGFSVAPQSGIPCLVIPCSTACGDFAVEIAIERRVAAAA